MLISRFALYRLRSVLWEGLPLVVCDGVCGLSGIMSERLNLVPSLPSFSGELIRLPRYNFRFTSDRLMTVRRGLVLDGAGDLSNIFDAGCDNSVSRATLCFEL